MVCNRCGDCCRARIKIITRGDGETINIIKTNDKPCIHFDDKRNICKIFDKLKEIRPRCYYFPMTKKEHDLFEKIGYKCNVGGFNEN